MFRFTIRDVLWLMVVVGLAGGWWVADRRWRKRDYDEHMRFHQVLSDILDPWLPTKTEVWGPYQGRERPPLRQPAENQLPQATNCAGEEPRINTDRHGSGP